MNAEHVEELLSAYLDNMLTPQEYDAVTLHLQECNACSSILADFRHFDGLLAQQQRVSPPALLKEKLFSSREYLELTGTLDGREQVNRRTSQELGSRPRLVSLPGGRASSSLPHPAERDIATSQLTSIPQPTRPFRRSSTPWWLRTLQIATVATVLLTVGIGIFIGWNLWQQQTRQVTTPGGITPPAAPAQSGPIPAGIRFVFLRDGVLWSSAGDGSAASIRLTTSSVTVATSWTIRPALPGHTEGNLLAYIDLQHGFIHTLRSDGQSDTTLQQPLLKAGVAPTSVWDTDTGRAILASLTWSNDGNMLAFIADPNGTGRTALYLYSVNTKQIQRVDFPNTERVFHPVWSPDDSRIAVGYSQHGAIGILDYNTQNHGILTIASSLIGSNNPGDTLQTLAWSPNADMPTLTWSVGSMGHVHTIWLRTLDATTAHILASGNYTQATYSQAGHNGVGSWLLVAAQAGRANDMLSVNLDFTTNALTRGKHVSDASWSPDGMYIDYFDSVTTDVGTLHEIDLATGNDKLIAAGVVVHPAPMWSTDSTSLLYTTGNRLFVLHKKVVQQLKLQGPILALSWSATSPHQIIASVGDGQEGVYIVDTQSNAVIQIDKTAMSGPMLWSEIP